MLRCTRPGDLVNILDSKLAAAAAGMNPEGVMIDLADPIDPGRLPSQHEPPAPAVQAQHQLMKGALSPLLSAMRWMVTVNLETGDAMWQDGFGSVLELWREVAAVGADDVAARPRRVYAADAGFILIWPERHRAGRSAREDP